MMLARYLKYMFTLFLITFRTTFKYELEFISFKADNNRVLGKEMFQIELKIVIIFVFIILCNV